MTREAVEIGLLGSDVREWEAFVVSHPGATNYHRARWRDVVERTFGHRTYYLFTRNREKITGILPMVLIRSRVFGNYLGSLPFFNYGGLLTVDGTAESALFHEAGRLARENDVDAVEFRHVEARDIQGPLRQRKVTMILNLAKAPDLQWKGFNPKLRNQIRKAEKYGLEFRIGGPEEIEAFYEVFARNMRDLGTPVYPMAFFRNVAAAFPREVRVAVVTDAGEVIAAGILCSFRDVLEIPWASSLREHKEKCPNNMLYWGVLKTAIAEGYRAFDFGRSSTGGGTYKFKEQWGARPFPLHWQYWIREGGALPDANTDNPKFALAIRAWQKLPMFVTKLFGPTIVRNIP